MGNVLINGRTAVHAGSGGTLTTVDVCLTKVGKPVVPIPYNNVAKSSDAAKTAGSVMINGHPVCTKSSVFSKSTGDEPGDRKGISSGTIQGKAEFISASDNVMFEGAQAARQGDMMVSNNKNTPPAPLAQAGAGKPPKLDVGEAQQLDASEAPHKLALELAGAELAGLKGSLVAEGPHLAELPLSRISDSDGRRYQLFFDSLPKGEYDLSLYYPDSRHGAYKLPFSQGLATCAKDKQSAAWDTVLVPIVPRCYTTAEPQRAQANYLRHEEGGWLYIFANGHLWRELKVEKEGSFRDVNLTYTKGLDHRDATVSLTDSRIVVPHRINGEPVTLEMAYSEVQWSWARIDAMGGMAEDAPRQDQGQQVPSGQAPDQAAQKRTARMQTIDLSGYPQGFNATEGLVGPSNEFPPQERWDLALHQNSQIAVVYLHDPLGVATRLHAQFFSAFQEAAQFLEKNARAKTISDIADAILEAKPKYAEQLREAERQAFKTDYGVQEKRFKEAYETASRNFLDYKQRQSAEPGATVESAYSDFDLNLLQHRERLEEIKKVLLTNVAVTEEGGKYITSQLKDDESLLNKILAFKDKAKDATDAIFNAVAAQLATIDGKWSVVAAFVQRRYLLEISRTEMSLVEFLGRGQVLHSKVVQQAMKVNVVETATIAMRYEPPRVTGITIAGHNLSVYAKRVTNNVAHAGIMLGLEAYNLVRAFREYGNQRNKFDSWVFTQFAINLGASAAGGASAVRGLQSAYLATKGSEKASNVAGKLAMRAGMAAAFIGAVYEVTLAYEESQSGDSDAAVSHSVMAGGALASGIGSALLLTAAVSNPIGWAVVISGILISVGGIISLLWTDNSPIEDWLLHSHWGVMAYSGEKEEKGKDGQIYLLNYTDWKNDPKAELEAYYRIVYGFEVSTSWDKIVPGTGLYNAFVEDPFAGFELFIEVPNFDPNRSQIICELKFQVGDQWQDLISEDKQVPPHRRYGKDSEPRKLVWKFKRDQIPKDAKRAEATIWYAPFGDGSILMPDEFGLKIETRRFGSNAKEG